VVTPQLDQDGGYWRLPAFGMQRAAEELKDYKLQLDFCSFDRGDQGSLATIVEELRSDPPDAVAIAPVLPDAAQALVDQLSTHIPVCCFDTELPGARTAFVGQDSVASGRLAAKLMRLLLAPGTHPVIVQPVEADHHIRGRISGFRAGFEDEDRDRDRDRDGDSDSDGESRPRTGEGSAPIPIYVQPNLNPDSARELVNRIFIEEASCGGLFVTNALVHLVAQALVETGRTRVPLIGYDVLSANREHVEQGTIDFLLSQRPRLQGHKAITLLFEQIQRRLVGAAFGAESEWGNSRTIMPLDVVTAENVAYYIDL
jgi:LacI family transcriptional regulator